MKNQDKKKKIIVSKPHVLKISFIINTFKIGKSYEIPEIELRF